MVGKVIRAMRLFDESSFQVHQLRMRTTISMRGIIRIIGLTAFV
jgi:hypothetical protein